jgi:CRISPR-associated protein Cas1
MIERAAAATSIEELLGVEGAAAAMYFVVFDRMLKTPDLAFSFEKRNRRPPEDPVNAMLSFACALLVKNLTVAITIAGLDPLLGFYHQPRAGRPALALDLMEEFRPIIADSVVVTAVNTGVVSAGDFVRSAGACALSSRGRKSFIAAYERRMDQEIEHPVFGYRASYRRVLELQARLLAKFLTGEIAEYPTFNTR